MVDAEAVPGYLVVYAVEEGGRLGHCLRVARGGDEQVDVQSLGGGSDPYVLQAVGRPGVRPEEVLDQRNRGCGDGVGRRTGQVPQDHPHAVQSQPMT